MLLLSKMCGRFALARTTEEIVREFQNNNVTIHANNNTITPSYNIAPTSIHPAIYYCEQSHQFNLHLMSFGLIPNCFRKQSKPRKLINVREDSLSGKFPKGLFKSMRNHKRCIIPATGYYEWHAESSRGKKTPYYFTVENQHIFYFAGLYEKYEPSKNDPSSDNGFTFAIITSKAQKNISHLHDRMPVILPNNKEVLQSWMQSDTPWTDIEKYIINVTPPLTFYEISLKVNNPRYDSKDIIEPVIKSEHDESPRIKTENETLDRFVQRKNLKHKLEMKFDDNEPLMKFFKKEQI